MNLLPILNDPRVAERTSAMTRKVLKERVQPALYKPLLNAEHMRMLRLLVDTILPQHAVGTHVHIAEAIDRRLAAGENPGFRYAVLPPDDEAYRQGLTAFFRTAEQNSMQSFEAMSVSAREDFIRLVCNGDLDGAAQFPLAMFVRMVRSDSVRFFVAHPEAMQAMGYFGFADGATGNEGWSEIGPNSSAPFEHAAEPFSTQDGGAR